MPHLNAPIATGGPLIDLLLGVSSPREHALRKSDQPVPQVIAIRGLIDTGAGGTCVDLALLRQLGLTPTGQILIHTPSTGKTPQPCDQFDVSLVIQHPQISFQFRALAVTACDLSTQGIQALIGRDVLSNCLFVYDGRAGNFALAF